MFGEPSASRVCLVLYRAELCRRGVSEDGKTRRWSRRFAAVSIGSGIPLRQASAFKLQGGSSSAASVNPPICWECPKSRPWTAAGGALPQLLQGNWD